MSEPEYLVIGQVLGPCGIEGKLKVAVITDFPQRFTPVATVYINHQPMTISSTEWRRGTVIIKLDTINSLEQARKLRGNTIEIPHHHQPLPQEHYYLFQIIGLRVQTTQGKQLGKVTEIIAARNNDIYVIRGDGGEILIPAIKEVIKSVDLDRGQMVIKPIPGLLSLNQKT
ncbi:MAG: 16S rRNA processing protein RimM [Dehalococcoidales bacterium]|nr:16S rRNA processing protein RimM [Dehalococcoidales bacterium]